MSTLQPTPDGGSLVIPMLVCRDAAAEIEFCKAALGEVEMSRRPAQDGTVIHALLNIGEAMIVDHGDLPSLASRAPQPDGSSPLIGSKLI